MYNPVFVVNTNRKKPTLGSAFPNMMQLLCVAETLIFSTSYIFSKVQLTVTLHRNRLNVKTVNNILMVGTNTNSVEDLDVDKCAKIFYNRKQEFVKTESIFVPVFLI